VLKLAGVVRPLLGLLYPRLDQTRNGTPQLRQCAIVQADLMEQMWQLPLETANLALLDIYLTQKSAELCDRHMLGKHRVDYAAFDR